MFTVGVFGDLSVQCWGVWGFSVGIQVGLQILVFVSNKLWVPHMVVLVCSVYIECSKQYIHMYRYMNQLTLLDVCYIEWQLNGVDRFVAYFTHIIHRQIDSVIIEREFIVRYTLRYSLDMDIQSIKYTTISYNRLHTKSGSYIYQIPNQQSNTLGVSTEKSLHIYNIRRESITLSNIYSWNAVRSFHCIKSTIVPVSVINCV